MYDPTIGRWLSEDPSGFGAGDTNLSRYVGNDATNATDPSGLQHGEAGTMSPQAQMQLSATFQGYKRNLQRIAEAKVATDDRFPAVWYYKDVLDLYTWDWLGLKENDDYLEYQRGCVGLCKIRLGLPYGGWATSEALKGFTDFESAMKYAKELPGQDGKKVRIFAVLFDKLLMPEAKWKEIKGEVPDPKKVVNLSDHKDFLTLHQPGEDQSTWFWESMNHSFNPDDEKAMKDAPPKVLHRPFDSVMPNNVKDKTKYNYVMFCVVYAKDSSRLPPAKTYGK